MADKNKTTVMTEEVSGPMANTFCQPCSRNNVKNGTVKYCLDCEEYQCDDCVKAHQLFPVIKSHVLLDLCDMEQILPGYDMRDLDQCKQHDRRLEFFCEDDSTLCCSKCATGCLRKCDSVKDIEIIADQIQKNWTSMLQCIMNVEIKAKKIEKHVKGQRRAVAKGSSAVQSRIQMTQDKVNKLFDNLKKNVDIEIKSFQDKKYTSLDEMEKSCQPLVAKVEATRCDINGISQHGTEVTIATDTDSLSHETCDKSMQAVDRTKEHNKPSLKCFASHDLKQEDGDNGEPWYSGLDFLPDGRLVAVDFNNKKCVLYNQQLEHLSHLQLVYQPCGVAVSSTSHIIITSGSRKKLYTYKIDKSSKISQVKCIDVSANFESVSVVNENTVCLGTLKNVTPVLFLSLQGEQRELNLKFPKKSFRIGQSSCAYLQKIAKIVFTDRWADTVYIHCY